MYFIIAWCNQLYVVNLERNYLIGVSIQDSSFIIFLYSEGVSWTAKFVIFIALNKFSFSQQYTTHTCTCILLHNSIADMYIAGADPGFQVRGDALKKIAPSEGRRENCWGISCEISRFYAKKSYFFNCRGRRENVWGISCEKSRFWAKKSYFFQLPRETRKFLSYFVWKITILRQQIIFISNFRGCTPGAPPLNQPLHCVVFLLYFSSSCVPYVVSFSRLFIFDSPFGIL